MNQQTISFIAKRGLGIAALFLLCGSLQGASSGDTNQGQDDILKKMAGQYFKSPIGTALTTIYKGCYESNLETYCNQLYSLEQTSLNCGGGGTGYSQTYGDGSSTTASTSSSTSSIGSNASKTFYCRCDCYAVYTLGASYGSTDSSGLNSCITGCKGIE